MRVNLKDKLRMMITPETISKISINKLTSSIGNIDLFLVLDISSYGIDDVSDVYCSKFGVYSQNINWTHDTKNKTLSLLQYNWELGDLYIDFYSITHQRNLRIEKLLSDSVI